MWWKALRLFLSLTDGVAYLHNSIGGGCDIKKLFYGDIPGNRREKVSSCIIRTISYFTYPWYPHVGIVAKGVRIIKVALYMYIEYM